MAKAVRKEPWFAYFPNDYRWSAGVSIAYSTSFWGSSTMGEVDRVCRKLKGKEGDDDAWFDEWVSEADRMRSLGMAAARKKEQSLRRRLLQAGVFLLPTRRAVQDAQGQGGERRVS